MNDNTQLQQTVIDLKLEIEEWKNKYNSILEQYRLSQQRQYTSSSEKNILQGELFDEAGAEIKETKEQDEAEVIEVPAHARNKPKRKPLPENLPREEVIHDIDESQKTCECGCKKEHFGEEITEQLKAVRPKLSVIRHIRLKYACKQCESGVTIAPMPNLLLPKSNATASLIAFIIIAKYCDHLPLYRQEQIWKRYGIDIPRNTMCGWLLRVAELCEPLWQQLRLHLLAYDYAQADETPVQVLQEPDRSNTQKSYIWVYRGGCIKEKVVAYDYQETRSGQHAQNYLHGFKGYLQTDGYTGYNWTADLEQVTQLGCMAHARRPFAELVKLIKKPGKAHQALAFIQKLYVVEKEARDKQLAPWQRFELRNQKSKPILDKLKEWLEKTLRASPPQGKLGKGIKYMMDRWVELTNYLKDGRLEIDNNAIENCIRPFAVGRKGWLFMGSPKGARAGVIFYSLIQTCKANDINPENYFNYMLNRIRDCTTEEDYKTLLPFKIDPSDQN